MKKKCLLLFLSIYLLSLAARSQSTDPSIQKAVEAMGTMNLNNVQYAGTGKAGILGQSHSAGKDWPLLIIKSYTRTIDYAARSSSEEIVRIYDNPPAKGGGAPFLKESKQNNVVSGLPSPEALEEKHLQLLVTPHGFLKQALNSRVSTRKLKGSKSEISFPIGKYKISGVIDAQGIVEKVNTWIPNHVLGDMLIETIYSDYKDYNGIKFPAHIIQNQGGHVMFDLSVSSVQPNVSNVSISAPTTPPQQPIVVDSKKLSDWVWFLGGGSHNSLLLEFKDYVAVFEAPLHEARSLAVIAEVKKLVPNKPIRYVINSHHHFDHSGGLRTYVAEGATVITSAANKKFYEDAWKAPRTLSPDKLSSANKKATFLTVKDKYVLTDGIRSFELHLNQGSPHNASMLLGYIPQDKILIVVDEYSPGRLVDGKLVPVAQGFADNLFANLQRLKLDVTTIAPGHGAVVPFTEMVKDIGK